MHKGSPVMFAGSYYQVEKLGLPPNQSGFTFWCLRWFWWNLPHFRQWPLWHRHLLYLSDLEISAKSGFPEMQVAPVIIHFHRCFINQQLLGHPNLRKPPYLQNGDCKSLAPGVKDWAPNSLKSIAPLDLSRIGHRFEQRKHGPLSRVGKLTYF